MGGDERVERCTGVEDEGCKRMRGAGRRGGDEGEMALGCREGSAIGGGVFEEWECGARVRRVVAESELDRRGGGGGCVGKRSVEGRADRVSVGGTSGASRVDGRRAREARPEGFRNPKTESAAARVRAKLARTHAAI